MSAQAEKKKAKKATTDELLNYCAESRGIRKDALIELLGHAIETLEKTDGIWFAFSIKIKER